MSLVGTRPILPDELEQYELHHRARIAIKPGITGMWQVSGRSDITDFEEIVRLDTEWTISQVTVFQFYTPSSIEIYGVGNPNGALWTISMELQVYVVIMLGMVDSEA